MDPPRWKIITPSQYEWERRALDFIRAGLPNYDPYRAWANFEFQSHDGAIYEVDLLVLTKQGFWLVEIKSWPGKVSGDAGTWTRTHEGKTISEDNPVLLANRKAKALSSLLKAQQAVKNVRVPWLDALVFLSADNLQCELTGPAANRVVLKDRPAEESRPGRQGVLAALMNREGPGVDPDCRSLIDNKVAKALARAIEQAGIRQSQRSRRVGDYVLGELLADGPGYQDRLAKHASFEDVHCRVRQYTVAQADSEEDRQRRKRAAAREFQIIQSLNHPNILPVLDPDVLTRIGSVEDFLSLLDDVEDELTAPEELFVTDPLQAKRGDRLEGGYVVEKELGQGATAKALLPIKDDEQFVLKVALSEDDNARLHEEADALRSIHSEFIVAIHEELEMAGRTVLVLQKAGDETLAGLLRKEGVPSLDLLNRYGDDLLSALSSLERHGVAHRDIKPDNIGIRSLTKQRNQLILFDFSLARAPLDNIRVGTPGYLDPFLANRKPPRWDLAAERYSAGVTLYEMSMGFGCLPQWGTGKSDEAMTEDELVIDAEKFDSSVREGLVEFFLTALHRDPKKRFDMAWMRLEHTQDSRRRSVGRHRRNGSRAHDGTA